MFKKILIANRGEIAVRVHRSCREMGISTVAVHSEADADALHVKMANETVCIGPASATDSYLNMTAILSAAEVTDAEAIHPGYGFLSENSKFSEMCEDLGFAFIGPKAEHIDLMGDKTSAIAYATELGLPTVPGSGGVLKDEKHAEHIAEKIGYPVLIKASSGGGGRGMKVVHEKSELVNAFNMAKTESKAAFGDDRVYMEKYLITPRHIEVQVMCDKHGGVWVLGERDCSMQRRYQKVIEETPSPALKDEQRAKLFELCEDVCKKMSYVGAGTFEFLYENGEFYFIEMNTRLQVEHPVTEMVTGLDLVSWQIKVAAGEKLPMINGGFKPRGHSIECRINAEHAETFRPSPGKVTEYFTPGGPNVRVDSSLYTDCIVQPYYDSMVAKLIVHGKDRTDAMARMKRSLEEFIVGGIDTNLDLHKRLISNNAFLSGDYNIHSLQQMIDGE
ncbi:MAG: acetyl-CoA carboxylase biotin carboxylase subunit [Alphaproteobacteria bacterium]|nr:acetyl-CoA carboxylase biotin carboxylase subunit [Alphaproteobacteria bacterium]